MGAVEELVARAGGCAVIDGGFATQLEALGADINDPLWSAACLIARPNLVKEVTALAAPPPRRRAGMRIGDNWRAPRRQRRATGCLRCVLVVSCETQWALPHGAPITCSMQCCSR